MNYTRRARPNKTGEQSALDSPSRKNLIPWFLHRSTNFIIPPNAVAIWAPIFDKIPNPREKPPLALLVDYNSGHRWVPVRCQPVVKLQQTIPL